MASTFSAEVPGRAVESAMPFVGCRPRRDGQLGVQINRYVERGHRGPERPECGQVVIVRHVLLGKAVDHRALEAELIAILIADD